MTFTFEVKKELCTVSLDNECCKKAECYAFLLLSRDFSPNGINFKTENRLIAQRFCFLLSECCKYDAEIIPPSTEKGLYSIVISNKQACTAICEQFGHTGSELNLRFNRANVENECCHSAFLRGVFLACGNITAPEKDYHLELCISKKKLAGDISALLAESPIGQPKSVVRRSAYVLYYKESERIEDFVTLINAPICSMRIMQTKMVKELRNRLNRSTNCITANITKTTDAVRKQIDAIEYIDSTTGLDILSPELYEAAIFRRDNPDAPLSEMAQILSGNLSRSGVNHRLQKIIEISEKIKKEREKL